VAAGAAAWDSEEVGDGVVTLFACGDVMPGRGVDQILPHPGDPELQAARRPGDVAVVSIHWGSNWRYDVDADQVRFARALIDGGADLVHGHSSHHPRPIEVFRGKLILYGCGDCIDDYEGITGHRAYRGDLRLLYFASLEAGSGQLAALRMAPMRARKMRLHPAPAADRQWLRTVLDRISRRFGSRVDLQPDGMLILRMTRQLHAPRAKRRAWHDQTEEHSDALARSAA
jgi:poly-gamma-glutamate capsule biosynthesis protein CapA/YwtB (metallophosphatase superfamily)